VERDSGGERKRLMEVVGGREDKGEVERGKGREGREGWKDEREFGAGWFVAADVEQDW
jgi:hypothetical protein